jgi:hypothetical protein
LTSFHLTKREYTTGYVGGQAADSDKGAGVVALTMFDLRRRGKVDRLGMCGVNVCMHENQAHILSPYLAGRTFSFF